jgi:hypothetical protein
MFQGRLFSLIHASATTISAFHIRPRFIINHRFNAAFFRNCANGISRSETSPSQPMSGPATGLRQGRDPASAMVRLVVLSDTHGQHEQLTSQLPAGDILLHCGDFSDQGSIDDARSFVRWLSSLSQYAEKLVIDGNHDRHLAVAPDEEGEAAAAVDERPRDGGCRPMDLDHAMMDLPALFAEAADPSVRLLRDETYVSHRHHGLVVHGSSWQTCEDQAYRAHRPPWGVDVWMVHFPPYLRSGNVMTLSHQTPPWFFEGWRGSREITRLVRDGPIPLCLSGHFHYARGVLQCQPPEWQPDETFATTTVHPTFVNAANCWRSHEDRSRHGVSPPIVIDFNVTTKKVSIVQFDPHPV